MTNKRNPFEQLPDELKQSFMLLAAERMDWMQVILNESAPCFHFQDDGKFCGRAERWAGHQIEAHGETHKFISLVQLLEQFRSYNPTNLAELQKDKDALVAVRRELSESFALAEEQHNSEKLGGNIVKLEYWKGELAALHRIRQAIDAAMKKGEE